MSSQAHHLLRVNAPESFTWLNGLQPAMSGLQSATAQCFGMHCMYVAWDVLRFYPNEFVLAIPELVQPPVEYFFACTNGGKRWFCFVVTQKTPVHSAALVFEVSPYVLMVQAMGLRMVPPAGRNQAVRDVPLAPNRAVLCPLNGEPVHFEMLLPDVQTYVCAWEGIPSIDPWANDASKAGTTAPNTAMVPLFFDVGSPLFQPMRINGNANMMSALAALGVA
jgi:hypothetical protein